MLYGRDDGSGDDHDVWHYNRSIFESEVGGWYEPGNLNGSCVRDPVAGALEFD